VLSIQNLLTRNTGSSMKANQIKGLDVQQVDRLGISLNSTSDFVPLRPPVSLIAAGVGAK
jgi:hypothetical protein